MKAFAPRILILAPHPDDEVVGVSAAIRRARAGGAEVAVLFLTHGCLPLDTLWPWQRRAYEENVARRMLEAHMATAILGHTILETHRTQGGMLRPARTLWQNLAAVWDDVQQALAAFTPGALWVPAYEGGNPDHDALNALASRVRGVPVFEFAEYHFSGQREHVGRFIAPVGHEEILQLSPEERATKRAALDVYDSERSNLRYFRRMTQESLRPLAAYDYMQAPHQGTLWYARHQWVPFRHPRVDFTRSPQVSAAIAHFLEWHP